MIKQEVRNQICNLEIESPYSVTVEADYENNKIEIDNTITVSVRQDNSGVNIVSIIIGNDRQDLNVEINTKTNRSTIFTKDNSSKAFFNDCIFKYSNKKYSLEYRILINTLIIKENEVRRWPNKTQKKKYLLNAKKM